MTIRILLIEDNPPDRVRYRRMLQQGSDAIEVVEAADGASGLALLDDSFSCVLLDQGLPDMQGLEILKVISALPLPPPVIMLTGEEDAAVSIEALQLGAADYLMKRRIDEDRLLRAVRGAIDRAEMQRRLEAQQHRIDRFYRLVNQTEDALFITEAATGKITESNEAARIILGLADQEGQGALPPAAFATAEVWRTFCLHAEKNGSARYECNFRLSDGFESTIEILARAIEEDGTAYIVAVGRDVSMRKRNEKLLIERSLHDSLTEIWNRRAFDERLAELSRASIRSCRPLSVALIDVDHFKAYNDALGHPAGDACLQRIAQALRTNVLRSGSMLARYGGEEFAALLDDTDAVAAEAAAERLRKAVAGLALPHPGVGADAYVTVSVGVASLLPSAEMDAAGLVRTADLALYDAKQLGRNRVVAKIL